MKNTVKVVIKMNNMYLDVDKVMMIMIFKMNPMRSIKMNMRMKNIKKELKDKMKIDEFLKKKKEGKMLIFMKNMTVDLVI